MMKATKEDVSRGNISSSLIAMILSQIPVKWQKTVLGCILSCDAVPKGLTTFNKTEYTELSGTRPRFNQTIIIG